MKLDYSDIHFADDGRLKLVIIVGTRPNHPSGSSNQQMP